MTNPLQAYALAEISIDDDDKEAMVVKAFQLMLEKIEVIKDSIENRDHARKYRELSKMTTALAVLASSLDMSLGELPRRLHAIYYYLERRLQEVHRTLDLKTINECKDIISSLSDGFSEAYKEEKAKKKRVIPPQACFSVRSNV
jgi:flagellar biosynthetic protein FliS